MARVNLTPRPLLSFFLLGTPYFCYPLYLLTWRTRFLARGLNTHPLFSLVCYQLHNLCCFSHPNTPYRSSYNIYIDDINNISCPRLTQVDLYIPLMPSQKNLLNGRNLPILMKKLFKVRHFIV